MRSVDGNVEGALLFEINGQGQWRVRDQGTVVIPVRSAARDKVIQEKLKAFQTDQNMTRNAIDAALGRGAEQRRVNAAIGEAMDRLGIDRSDRTYIYLHKMALEALLARGISTSDLSDEELVSLWERPMLSRAMSSCSCPSWRRCCSCR